jgi:hypothetical protein
MWPLKELCSVTVVRRSKKGVAVGRSIQNHAKSGDPSQPRIVSSSRCTFSGSASGVIPWPRLKM